MIWLILVTGIQILGFAITLGHLAHDEWRTSRNRASEDRQIRMEIKPWRKATT